MLPAPTTSSPDSSTVFTGVRRACRPAWKPASSSAGSNGSGPSADSSLRAGSASSDGDQTTAPKRRGSVSHRQPRSVSRRKWSYGPALGGRRRRTQRARHAQVDQQAARPARPQARRLPSRGRPGRRLASAGGESRAPAAATGTCRAASSRRRRCPTSARGSMPQRPAQRQAHLHVAHPRAQQSAGNAAARNFYLWQLGHGDFSGPRMD